MHVTLLPGDCLTLLPTLPAQSVDLVLADLPYGTTACKWDSVLPLDVLWREYRRVLKPRGAVVLTAAQPFTSTLVLSNLEWFKYDWVWRKTRPTGFLDAKRRPLRAHESVCVFAPQVTAYNPQMQQGAPHSRLPWGKRSQSQNYGAYGLDLVIDGATETTEYYPQTVIEFPSVNNPQHPTQKPVALMSYLIKTYSNPGAVVLDNTMGSGTTGVACVETGRAFIGVESDLTYFAIAAARIAHAQAQQPAAVQPALEMTA